MKCGRSISALRVGIAAALVASVVGAQTPSAPKDENAQAGYLPGYRRAVGLGLSPHAPASPSLPGGMTVPFSAPEPTDEWTFGFKGYMSVSARASRGARENPTGDQFGTTLHGLPQVPDSYGKFSGTNVTQGSWVNLTFEYGNSSVTSHVELTTWKPTGATDWTAVGSQNFVDQAYLLFHAVPVDKLRLDWTVGAHRDTYGGLGQYGVGQYNTQIVGMPFGVGETLGAAYDIDETYTVHLEHGIMGKLAKTPEGVVPSIMNGGSNPALPSSWVHHAHLGFEKRGEIPLVLAVHYLRNWSQDERDQLDDPKTSWIDESQRPDAKMTVVGADFRMIENHLGNFAIAASYVDAKDADLLTGLNYFGAYSGEQLTKRFLGPRGGGTGRMLIGGFEYNVSWGKFLRYPEGFGGEGADLITSIFAQAGSVRGDDPDYDGRKMYKAGTEITYRPLSWLSLSGRYDHVIPNSRDKKETFDVISPKLLFKTNWNSHEQVTLSYTRWLYGEHTHGEFPDEWTRQQLDNEMYALSFGMWW
jgi:hypothetical protein